MDGSGIFGRHTSDDSDPDLVDNAQTLGKQADTPGASAPGAVAAAAANDDTLLGGEQIRNEFQNERGIKVHTWTAAATPI